MVEVYIDGSSIGNPGRMAAAYAIYRDKRIIKKEGVYLGIGTNNFSEYMAFIISLIEVLSLGEKSCHVYSDSNLLCEQINGNFKVKSKNIYPLFVLAKKISEKFDEFSIRHINREKNHEVDKLAKDAAGFLM